MTARFTSVSAANCLLSRCLRDPKTWKSLGFILPTGLVTGYDAMAGRLRKTFPTTPISCSEIPDFQDGKHADYGLLDCDTLPPVFKYQHFGGACGVNYHSIRKSQWILSKLLYLDVILHGVISQTFIISNGVITKTLETEINLNFT